MILEVFTTHEDENEALKLMTTINVEVKDAVKNKVASTIRSISGEKGIKTIKRIIGKK